MGRVVKDLNVEDLNLTKNIAEAKPVGGTPELIKKQKVYDKYPEYNADGLSMAASYAVLSKKLRQVAYERFLAQEPPVKNEAQSSVKVSTLPPVLPSVLLPNPVLRVTVDAALDSTKIKAMTGFELKPFS